MIWEGDRSRAICVVGRRSFRSGIGAITVAACELLSRSFDVALLDSFEPEATGYAALPNGRLIPLVSSAEGFACTFFCDVLWNGEEDHRAELVPDHGFRVVQLAFDSDRLPSQWVDVINDRFDVALGTAPHLERVIRDSGVKTAVGTLPIALPLEGLLAGRRTAVPVGRPLRFGVLSAFHPRKGLAETITAFMETFGESPNEQLMVHSNLDVAGTFARLASAEFENVIVDREDLSGSQRDAFIESLDIYVNCSAGEGYSIGPREAAAAGKVLVLSELEAHSDLFDLPGVFVVPAEGTRPARYPEIDGITTGVQRVFPVTAIGEALAEAWDYVRVREPPEAARERRQRAAEFSFTNLESAYSAVFDPEIRARTSVSVRARLDHSAMSMARQATGRHAAAIRPRGRLIVELRDAGFFSLFNVFLSHLTWAESDPSIAMVLPDWRVETLLANSPDGTLDSYCYSQAGQGNLWNLLFEPLYDLDPEELNDPEFLADGARCPRFICNEDKEPLLTYVNAYQLYQEASYDRIRKQYRDTLDRHVRLDPARQAEIDRFVASKFAGRYAIAAHVKHPAHVTEQPGGVIAGRERYVHSIRRSLAVRGIAESSDDWRVFLATDQERVVDLFTEEFGENVVTFSDVQRTPANVDEEYDRLPEEEQSAEVGHQFQHLMARRPETWSHALAWEVWRDAATMAECDTVLHVVSNVSTAVGFMNPTAEMVFCEH